MKCVLCGKESTKPVCHVCARELAMEHPFLLIRGFASGNFAGGDYESGIIFPEMLKWLNAQARRGLMGEDVEFLRLARAALRFHREYQDYLSIFDIERNYYLRLAKQFAERDTSVDGRYILARIYEEEGTLDEALEVMEGIWKESREYAVYYARLLTAAGKWGRAIEIYNELLKSDPEDVEVWELLADALMSAEQWEDAERAYLRVLQVNRDSSRVWFKRGLCLRKLGKWGGALQSFQTAVRKDPKNREAYENILDILLERNMYSRARETLKMMMDEGFDVDERIKEIEGLMRE